MRQWTNDCIGSDSARTLDALFVQRLKCSPQRVAYRYYVRESGWHDLSWAAMGEAVARWRVALASEALEPGDRVGMVLRNCPEWVMFDQAALALGLVTVPLYTDDRADNAAYILQDAGVKVLLVQDAGRWRRLAEAIGEAPCPQRVVILESSTIAHQLARSDARVVVAEEWLPEQAPALEVRENARGEELATIVYTSGTTGRPKGVMLSHRNILANAQAALQLIDVYREDVFLSFLPLSHMLERTASYYLPMIAGSTVAYARSVGQLAEDLQTIHPTLMIAVPRVFERFYQRLLDQLNTRPAPARWLFHLAVNAGWHRFLYEQGRARWHPRLLLWPLLRARVGAPVLARLGGRLRGAISGGAALPFGVARTFIGLGLPLLQGYGLTETSPVISVNTLGANIPESVGVPLDAIELRIGADDELLVRGDTLMLGYWNNAEATAQVLHDGWFHTGDQARIAHNHLYITGRIKDILVLSNGEKVSPADMELAIALDPLIEQVLVLGEGHSYLSALIVLNAAQWPTLAREHDLDPGDPASLADPRLVKNMLKRIRHAIRDFPGYAKVRRITLLLEPWSIENGLLTPTLKVRRAQVVARHHAAIERMYSLDPELA